MAEGQLNETIKNVASSFNERRNNGRCSFVASADMVHINSNSRLAARTTDIDRGGCYIDTLNPLAVGTTLALRITKANQSFTAYAKVVYVQSGNGMGLAFTTADAGQLQTLDQWIAGLDATL
jgi:hypothetical protein